MVTTNSFQSPALRLVVLVEQFKELSPFNQSLVPLMNLGGFMQIHPTWHDSGLEALL